MLSEMFKWPSPLPLDTIISLMHCMKRPAKISFRVNPHFFVATNRILLSNGFPFKYDFVEQCFFTSAQNTSKILTNLKEACTWR